MALKDEYFTISEAAKELNVTRQTISRWIKQRKIVAEKIGRETLVKKDEIRNYMELPKKMAYLKWAVKEAELMARKEYDYDSKDSFKFTNFYVEKGKGVYVFNVTRKDGIKEVVNVKVVPDLNISESLVPTIFLAPKGFLRKEVQEFRAQDNQIKSTEGKKHLSE